MVTLPKIAVKERINSLVFVEKSIDELNEEIKPIKHISEAVASIKEAALANAKGVIIKSKSVHDAYIIAQYIIKLCAKIDKNMVLEDSDDNYEYLKVKNYNEMKKLPYIPRVNVNDFVNVYRNNGRVRKPIERETINNSKEDSKRDNSEWCQLTLPLVIEIPTEERYPGDNKIRNFNQEQFLIKIYHGYTHPSTFERRYSEHIRKFIFEHDYIMVQVKEPDESYYAEFLNNLLKTNNSPQLSENQLEMIVKKFKEFRGEYFEGISDYIKLINKAKLLKTGELITLEVLEEVISYQALIDNKEDEEKLEKQATVKLEGLVGLDKIKEQLNNQMKRIVLETNRVKKGKQKAVGHLSAVFFGNPGTAKTTVARHFGNLLKQKRILTSNVFHEVSRQDLVGRYLGWTSYKVQEAFKEAEGGVLFIDEAYSLNPNGDNGRQDPYAKEALAEIVLQMENNPNTLVIFAGYKDEMKKFIEQANTGLRSRLTKIIEFEDYSPQEMAEIFFYLVEQDDFKIKRGHKQKIRNFIEHNVARVGDPKKTGNGRLMRKLFKDSIGFLANRDLESEHLEFSDVRGALDAIIDNEKILIDNGDKHQIGFC